MSRVGRTPFVYQRRDDAQAKDRASQTAGLFDTYLHEMFRPWKVPVGEHTVRIMPPTWPNATHWGMDVLVHFEIGPDSCSYLCLDMQQVGLCPICLERARIQRTDPEYAKALAPTKRIACWIVDRDNEADGPQIWVMSFTLDRDISMNSIDKGSGQVLCIDHPGQGYDVSFCREGMGKKATKYRGIQIARVATPLGSSEVVEDEWLAYVESYPIPNCLVFYPQEHIQSVFAGGESINQGINAAQAEQQMETRAARREVPAERGRRFEEVPPPPTVAAPAAPMPAPAPVAAPVALPPTYPAAPVAAPVAVAAPAPVAPPVPIAAPVPVPAPVAAPVAQPVAVPAPAGRVRVNLSAPVLPAAPVAAAAVPPGTPPWPAAPAVAAPVTDRRSLFEAIDPPGDNIPF